MKLVGLVGGVSWVSTIEYYRIINELVNTRLGGDSFAQCLIYSLNFGDVKKNQLRNDHEATYNLLFDAASRLKAAGAEAIVLCANTMHMRAEDLQEEIGLPVIHIAVATAKEIESAGVSKVGLLGTRFTMEMDFFKDKLKARNIECLVPEEGDREFIHQSIARELSRGIFSDSTRERYKEIIRKLEQQGCKGIILGCTEIPLLIKQSDCTALTFDTTAIHSAATVDFMLSDVEVPI